MTDHLLLDYCGAHLWPMAAVTAESTSLGGEWVWGGGQEDSQEPQGGRHRAGAPTTPFSQNGADLLVGCFWHRTVLFGNPLVS